MEKTHCLLVIDESWMIGHTTQHGPVDFPRLLKLANQFGQLGLAVFYAEFRHFYDTKIPLAARAYGILTVHVPAYRNGSGHEKSETDPAIFTDVERFLSITPSVRTVLLAAGDGTFLYQLQALVNRGYRAVVIGLPGITHWRLKLPGTPWDYIEYQPGLDQAAPPGDTAGLSDTEKSILHQIASIERHYPFLTSKHIVNVFRDRGYLASLKMSEEELRAALNRLVDRGVLVKYSHHELSALRLVSDHPAVLACRDVVCADGTSASL